MIYTIPDAGGIEPGATFGALSHGSALQRADLLLLWLAAVNILAFGAFALDKMLAQRGAWRISERTLLTLALVGGSPGAVAAQHVFRHKTRKEPFRSRLRRIVVLHLVVVGLLMVPATREPLLQALGSM